jgi:uncharacterized protein YndB with AHSA1/START domain
MITSSTRSRSPGSHTCRRAASSASGAGGGTPASWPDIRSWSEAAARRRRVLKRDIEVTVEIEIAAPRQAVWEFVADTERLPDWFEEIESAHQESEGAAGVGSILRYTLEQGHRSGTMEFVEWEPGTRLAWDGPPLDWGGGGARPRGSFELADAGGGRTRFTGNFRPQLSGVQALLSPYLRWWLRRHREESARMMKALVEEVHRR